MEAELNEAKAAYNVWIGEDKIYLEKRITDYPLPSERLKAVEFGWREETRNKTNYPQAESFKVNYRITNLVFGDSKWAVVMTKGTNYTAQLWHTASSFPKEKIKESWDKGYYISNLFYGDSKWAIVLTKGTNYTTQSCHASNSFPEEKIKELWSK